MDIRCPVCQHVGPLWPYEGRPAVLCQSCGGWYMLRPSLLWEDALELLKMFGISPYLGETSVYNGLDFYVGTEESHKRVQIFSSYKGGITAITDIRMGNFDWSQNHSGFWEITI